MARLRRNSAEALGNTTDDEEPIARRRSPNKAREGHTEDVRGSSRDVATTFDGSQWSNLRRKKYQNIADSGKKVKLRSLKSLDAEQPLSAGFIPFEETRKQREQSKVMKRNTQLEKPVLLARSDSQLVRDNTANLERSNFAHPENHGDVSDDTEDDLPSPWRLLGLRAKPTATRQPHNGSLLNVEASLATITISGNEAPPARHGSISAKSGNRAPSRPSTGSTFDDPAAFLRFSPPRLCTSPPKQGSQGTLVTPPQSPSKSRLQSPSKLRSRVPTPPLRPSLDSFWNSGTINDWNDQYSPEKTLRSPKKSRLRQQEEESPFTRSPRPLLSPSKRNKREAELRKDFNERKHQIAEAFLVELDDVVAKGQIRQIAASTGGVRLIWSKTLNSTAGRANWRRETIKTRQLDGTVSQMQKQHASIELAEKVIDDQHRLLNVIAHEFCHLCNFMISDIKDQPHGAQFKAWGRQCTSAFEDRGIKVTTKHSYAIEYKYIWECSNEDCDAEFRRHSKSIDPQKHTCGRCRSKLIQVKPAPRKNAGGATTAYSAFVKEHFAGVKRGMVGASQKEVMKAVGEKYRAEKAAAVAEQVQESEKTRSSAEHSGSVSPDSLAHELEIVTLDDK